MRVGKFLPSSIHFEDLGRSADPCTDFFRYANGTWRAFSSKSGAAMIRTETDRCEVW